MDDSQDSESRSPRPVTARALLWLPLLPALAVFLTSLTSALRVALRLTGGRFIYALDDAYIHMAVARTFALHGIWGCTPFHFSSSSSSLLWTFLLGAAYGIGGTAFGVAIRYIGYSLTYAIAVGTEMIPTGMSRSRTMRRTIASC